LITLQQNDKIMRRFSSFLLIFFLFLAGCAPHREQTPDKTVNAFVVKLPAVYRADLSMKECPSMSFVLTLRPDGLYFLRAERGASGADQVQTEVGVWKSNAKRSIIQLNSYDNAVLTLAATRARRLRVLKVSGGIMPSLVRYEFVLTDTAPNYNDAVRMQGMYSRRPEGGTFRECLSGITFPVARGGGSSELERATLTALHGQGKSIYVVLDARLSSRRGRGERLVPVRFVHVDPARSCDGEESRITTITDNRWHLLEINGRKLEADSVKKIPFLKVKSRDSLIEGFAGCNRFSGTWFFTGDRFMFSRTAATRMACPVGMEVEDAFLRALDNTRRYQIKDNILELVDRSGEVRARLRYTGRW
jgi:copper homeostasis protein (lipoprotein)